MMKKWAALLLTSALIITLSACGGAKTQSNTLNGTTGTTAAISPEFDRDDLDFSLNSYQMSYITLQGDSIALRGSGAQIDGGKITIKSAGIFNISGTLNNGQIIVDNPGTETVKLVLNGANITCLSSAPINVLNAEKTIITLAQGSQNTVTDNQTYLPDDPDSEIPDAAIFSKDDLTINGDGSLLVKANYKNGIQSQDDLKITGGNITVEAVNDGIKGKDSLAVRDGNISVKAGGDGLQSNNDLYDERGYISIEGGVLNVTAGEDGLQSEKALSISGGRLTISSGGGSSHSVKTRGQGMPPGGNLGNMGGGAATAADNATPSAKGLKAGTDITITGGTVNIDASDDSINANGCLKISGGSLTLASGDDGMHANTNLEIDGGDINISKCYEGIESANISINDGTIHLTSSDDGINVITSGTGNQFGGPPGQNAANMTITNYLNINGGCLVINAGGDGLDSNGSINMSGGEVIVNGPTNNGNGALDYAGAFNMTGGLLVATGSSGMAQTTSSSSTQYSIMVNFTAAQPANTLVHIETQDGKDILTFSPTKTYQSVVLCSPDLQKASTYLVYCGGSSTGTMKNGLYSSGVYTAGIQYTSLTISGMVTTYGSGGGAPGGGQGGAPGGGMRAPGGGRP